MELGVAQNGKGVLRTNKAVNTDAQVRPLRCFGSNAPALVRRLPLRCAAGGAL
jgi:hypothetical protein